LVQGRENLLQKPLQEKRMKVCFINLWSVRWDVATKLLYCVARDGQGKKSEQDEKILLSEQRFKSLGVRKGYDLLPLSN